MKVFVAVCVVAVGLSGAVWLRSYQESFHDSGHAAAGGGWSVPRDGTSLRHPSWADPLAVFVAVAGIGFGVVMVYRMTR